ncbi:MAG TPA: FAD-binding oxidoreductase [Bacillota bacterium]|nr:FAD-binding oxidoreductase [Bacillota bacterium]
MSNKKPFEPDWYEGPIPPKSYRSIFKWGGADEYKHPNLHLYELMKEVFEMTDEDFRAPVNLGLEEVSFDVPITLSGEHLKAITSIVGTENVATDDYSRLRASYGKMIYDNIRLREGIVENLPDIVVYPRHKQDVSEIIGYCNRHKIAVYPRGGGSGVMRATECVHGGISLDLTKHMNRILTLNEVNHTITVEPGMYLPDLEARLNKAPEFFGASRRYTAGYLPQSFIGATVGGSVVTRGAGQNSTYYGKIEDLVLCQEYVTPAGDIKTKEFPRAAVGPSIDQIMIGSEGTYGVLVSVTLKIFRYTPETTQRFSYIFPTWSNGLAASREMMQSRFGYPSVLRISDPEETDVALKLYGVEDTILDKMMDARGYKRMERCLMLGMSEGEENFAKNVKRQINRIAKRYGAMNTTGYVAKSWEKGRFTDPFMREDLHDYGIIIDTLECAVAWDKIESLWAETRKVCKARPKTVVMSHSSHFYPQGTNLYFIFIGCFETIDEYLDYQASIIDSIRANGGALSHHHGIGKMLAPWYQDAMGENHVAVLRALKRHFDPNNIMNPGGTLALDLEESFRRPIE